MLWRVTLAMTIVCVGSICSCVKADLMSRLVVPRDYGVKLCGREFIRAVIFTCGGSRWKRSSEADIESRQSSFPAQNAQHIWQHDAQFTDDLLPLNTASSSSSLADLLAVYGTTGDKQQRPSLIIPTLMESQPIPVLPEAEDSTGVSNWPVPSKRKRNFSLGVAGVCCTQGCTKNDIGRLC